MRFTNYIVKLRQKDKIILLNVATGGTIRVALDIYDKIKNNLIDEFTEAEKQFLYETSFLIKENEDEEKQRIKQTHYSSSLNLIFMTTENCNFKCEYCYEDHTNNHIEKDVYDSAIDYIKKSDKEEVMINWFGGEPLLEINNIEYFMSKVCKLEKVKRIKSSIITNGYLLNNKNFKRLINSKIKTFQITLDGLENEHDKKRLLKSGKGTFEQIVKNIKQIKETTVDFTVYLRYNYFESSDLVGYVDFIYNLLGNDRRFILDFHSIGDWTATYNGIPKAHKNGNVVLAIKKAHNLGMRVRMVEEDVCPIGYLCSAKLDDAVIINYKREVMKCTIMLDWDKNKVGTLNLDGTISYNENFLFWQTPVVSDKCKNCNVLPLCFNKYCPHEDYITCKERREQKAIDVLRILYE